MHPLTDVTLWEGLAHGSPVWVPLLAWGLLHLLAREVGRW